MRGAAYELGDSRGAPSRGAIGDTIPQVGRIGFVVAAGLLCAPILARTAASAQSSRAISRHAPPSTTSRQSFFYENANLHLASENGNAIAERGYARGTYNAPVVCTFHISTGHAIKAFYTIYPAGGSVSGEANARYVIKNDTGYYGGYMTIKKGTGRFNRASGRNIGFSGTINRSNYNVVTKVNGWMRQ